MINYDKDFLQDIKFVLVHDWDPIGISGVPGAEDEYDNYIIKVAKILMKREASEELFNYLWWVETQHMGLSGDKSNTMITVKRLLEKIDK